MGQVAVIIWGAVIFVMYSFLLSTFRIKNGGYPFWFLLLHRGSYMELVYVFKVERNISEVYKSQKACRIASFEAFIDRKGVLVAKVLNSVGLTSSCTSVYLDQTQTATGPLSSKFKLGVSGSNFSISINFSLFLDLDYYNLLGACSSQSDQCIAILLLDLSQIQMKLM